METTAIINWEQELLNAAALQGAAEHVEALFKSISTRGGILSVDDTPIPGNQIDVVVLASVHENKFYKTRFNPEAPVAPSCYAFLKEGEELAPHPEAKDKQADACATCWANAFGSADTGPGKACKNVRKLMLMTADSVESAASVAAAEVRSLTVPVTSVKGWGTYVSKTLAQDVKRPTWGAVTRIKVVPDAKSQFKVLFTFEKLVEFTQDIYDAIQKRVKEAEEAACVAYADPKAPEGAALVPHGRAAEAMGKPERRKY